MNRASLTAILAAAGLALAPTMAAADCHEPLGEAGAAEAPVEPTAGDADEDPAVLAEDDGAGETVGEAPSGSDDAEGGDDGEEVKAPEESAILPSAEGHLESEAPTMEIDCTATPELCSGDPIQNASEGPALSTGDDPGTEEVESGEGPVVVAEPQC